MVCGPATFVRRLGESVTAIQAPPELPGRNKNSLGRGGTLITGLPEHSTRKVKNELREIDFGCKCLNGRQKKKAINHLTNLTRSRTIVLGHQVCFRFQPT